MQLLLARPFISCAYPRTLEPARALAAETLKLEGSRLSAGKGGFGGRSGNWK
jgi:hypothetical protein